MMAAGAPEEREDHTPRIEMSRPDRWGWGWLLLIGFIGLSTSQAYARYEEYAGLLWVAGLAVALPVYFMLRNKYLDRIETPVNRSLAAGVASWLLAAFVGAALKPAVEYLICRNMDAEVRQIASEAKGYMQGHAQAIQTAEAGFVVSPQTRDQVNGNLSSIRTQIALIRRADSAQSAVFLKLDSSIARSIRMVPLLPSSLSYTLSGLREFSAKTHQTCQQKMITLETLARYYHVVLAGIEDPTPYYREYITAFHQLAVDTAEVNEVARRTGFSIQ
jgi:hypothetical protein